MKRAFLVLGPESTGTRLATRILIAGGCHGSDAHFPAFEKEPLDDLDPVVIRRSYPHNGRWGRVPDLLTMLGEREFRAVVTVRDWHVTADSQIRNRHVRDLETAREHMMKAYAEIFSQLRKASIPYETLVYESLLLTPNAVQGALLRSLGLVDHVDPVLIENGNKKYRRLSA